MPIQIQNRDVYIFTELYSCQFLTVSQLAELCFEGRQEAAKKRLGKLVDAGLIKRHSLNLFNPSLYLLSKSTFNVMRNYSAEGEMRRNYTNAPSTTTIKHELLLRDFRTALIVEAKKRSIQIHAFCMNAQALSFKVSGVTVRPDAYFEMEQNGRISKFFVEVDCGTEPQWIILRRAFAYRRFFQSRKEDPHKALFEALFLFQSGVRLKHFLKALFFRGFRRFIFGAIFDSHKHQVLSQKWLSPQDFRSDSATRENSTCVAPEAAGLETSARLLD